jgi:hypothetical protein
MADGIIYDGKILLEPVWAEVRLRNIPSKSGFEAK